MTVANMNSSLDGSTTSSYRLDFRTGVYLSTDTDYDEYVRHIFGEVTCIEEGSGGESRSRAGTLDGYLIRTDAIINNREDVFEVCDEHSQTLHEYSRVLFDVHTRTLKPKITAQLGDIVAENVLILDQVEVLPQHRGHGLGLAAVSSFIDTFGYGCGLVACEPYPMQFKEMTPDHIVWCTKMNVNAFGRDKKQALTKLRAHWSKLGFQRLRGTNKFALSPEYRRPVLSEVLGHASGL